jgi:prepilin-type N-terminal cleavage/methylation domain-containing protein
MNLNSIQSCNPARMPRGFTVIELAVTMSVAAILVGIAVPGFVSMGQSQRRVAEVSDLVVALNYARSEAVKQNTSTGVSVTANGSWGNGWTVCCTLSGTQVSGYAIDPADAIHQGFSGRPAGRGPASGMAVRIGRCVRLTS